MAKVAQVSKGKVGIEVDRNKLRLRLPRSVSEGSSRYITTGLEATPENWQKVQMLAWELEADIKAGQVDLAKYRDKFQPTKVVVVVSNDLVELWESYCQYMKPQLAVTTYYKDYIKKYANHIKKLPTKQVSEAIAIRDYLLVNLSLDAAKRVLTYISACCKWAKRSGMLTSNPFEDMAGDIKSPKVSRSIDPFSYSEREAIIEAFQEHPTHHHYLAFVRFLFLTGCRTGEAIALKWENVNTECTMVTFEASYDCSLKVRKCTKTGESRKFPCNPTLQAILLKQKQLALDDGRYSATALVFPSPTGLYINATKFTTQVWKGCISGNKTYLGIVTQLVKYGQVERYRCPYNTRHTYITMALESGVPVTLLAKWVGNSPEVIMKHYAGTLAVMDSPVT